MENTPPKTHKLCNKCRKVWTDLGHNDCWSCYFAANPDMKAELAGDVAAYPDWVPEGTIDHRELLAKYLRHLHFEEGSVFLWDRPDFISTEEWEELKKLDTEALAKIRTG